MIADFTGKAVLITGGTRGIGLATALEFGLRGATCLLACDPEAVDGETIGRLFAEVGAPPPHILHNAGLGNATTNNQRPTLREALRERGEFIEALICAPAPSATVDAFTQYNKVDFLNSLDSGAWQLVAQTQQVHEVCGRHPRYVVALSPASAVEYSPGQDFNAASNAAMEVLCRYMNYHLRDEEVRINVLRYRDSHRVGVLEPESANELDSINRTPGHLHATDEDVARAVVALCSGLMDCMRGHVLTVDRGGLFCDNLMRLYNERAV